jgi:hypothetical protein
VARRNPRTPKGSNRADAIVGGTRHKRLELFIGIDGPVSSARIQELLGWSPTHPGLIADLEHGHFFDEPGGTH